jgi:hypothetical protein
MFLKNVYSVVDFGDHEAGPEPAATILRIRRRKERCVLAAAEGGAQPEAPVFRP